MFTYFSREQLLLMLLQSVLAKYISFLFQLCLGSLCGCFRPAFLKLFFKWGPLSLVRMFYGPPYSWNYQTH